jgi:FkbM family methyltransferase
MSVRRFLQAACASALRRRRNPLNESAALARLAPHIQGIRTVIDIGASDGRWSRDVKAVLPAARYLLFEANPAHAPQLERYQAEHPRDVIVLAAASDRAGEVFFHMRPEDPFAGQAAREESAVFPHRVPSRTIDDEVARHGLEPPFLIKLDTHGFELPILNGAPQTLAAAGLLALEVYNLKPSADALLFWELCADLAGRGFRPADIAEPLWTDPERVLWQIDMFFLPASSPVFTNR